MASWDTDDFPTDIQLYNLAEGIGKEKLRTAALLGISEAEVERIERDHVRNELDQIRAILLKWRDRSNLDPEQRCSQLKQCFRQCGRESLVVMVQQFYDEKPQQDIPTETDVVLFPYDEQLRLLADKIGNEKGKLATYLGIEQGKLEQIENDHVRSAHEQNWRILTMWRDNSPLNPQEKCKQLHEGLEKCGKMPLVNMVKQWQESSMPTTAAQQDQGITYRGQNTPSSTPLLTPVVQIQHQSPQVETQASLMQAGKPSTTHLTLQDQESNDHMVFDISNRWRIGELLGSGATGKVYKCYDNHNRRELAAKKILIDSKNPEISEEIEAFRSEIQVLKNLQHERIVQYIDFQEGPDFYIFLEYMPGGSIRHQISAHGALSEKVTQKYTKQILEGLTYLHQRNVIHRDIKCGNILKDNSDNVKLADFGVSKKMQTICSSKAKTFVGTVYWMSPEIITGKVYGRKVDIWSVGCTIVEMLTKNPPWYQLEVHAAMYKIGNGEKPMYELLQNSSSSCEDFIKSCLQTNPENRPSAESLMSHVFINSENLDE